MCGIVAVSGTPEAARLAFLGLYALQHRGQEAAGLAVFDRRRGQGRVHRAAGLASEVFRRDVLDTLQGDVAVGHLRYSTAGGPGVENAQPIWVRFRGGTLALAHNGNLTNARRLRAALEADGALFQTTSDSEVLVHLIARGYDGDADTALRQALLQVEGAFSVLLAINGTIYAARDPFGFRPLVLGTLGEAFVFASETCALDLVGARRLHDLAPGEVLKLENGELRALEPLPPAARPAPCVFEYVYFARPDSDLWGVPVDRARRAFGRRLAEEHPAAADLVIAVPDSANSAALGYAERSGLPFELGLIRNHYVGRTFIEPAGRDLKVRLKYNAVRAILQGRRVVVVDDSLVRGTTSRGLVKLLREAGAREIHLRLASPPVRHPCFYGIDMPTRAELLAAEHSVDEIRAFLGVDSVGYLSLAGMLDCMRELGHQDLCTACFSGAYPTPVADGASVTSSARPDIVSVP